MKRAKFNRGDIVRLNLNPTAGREQQGDFRPALIISPAAFNVSGLVLIAPITQGGDFARYAGFAVPLSGSGTDTQGVVLCNQIRTVDLEARGAKRVESVPEVVMDDVLARIQVLIE
ncbi:MULTISPECIES: type II toxin-antitoxin system ChpB family toxin [Pseudomonas syringae group genomosp. 2]|uniref:type II toxin-antitoxin system ChpB family toxin n=1 Tax=Pseudomonas syringae group genomosp. 2 TaxID=251698 RepID=UPI0006B9919F|nr:MULTISPECIES: type II toxin-antitoxin system ChpB family toxin [Pseudomonas syringae group genomosp. 2]KPB58730.1 PemK-like protein [Pseudomonas savastanoi pv. phaseolicola]KPB73282.1 PemK-like protein [Pseudomonas amygdali pv. mellea]